jgi:predicted permease
MVHTMMSTLRYAFRSLARSPGYALAFILTLGLGIGLNTAIFSVVNGVLLAPLPYADADRLVYVEQPALQTGTVESFSFVEVGDYRGAARTVDELVEYGDLTFNVVGEGEPHRAVGGLVTSNYFTVLGLRPQLGRLLGPQDDGEGAEPVMVLTHDYWTRVYGADPGVIDRTLKLYVFGEARTARIVGVLARGTLYTGSRRQEFFVNYASNGHYGGAAMLNERTHRMTDVFARLAPGQTVEAARAEFASLNVAVRNQFPDAYPATRGYSISLTPWREALTQDARPVLLILTGAVLLVLLLACANVANLTLTRLVRRERELAVRAALGAGSRRIRAGLLTENLILALAGAALGLLLAVLGMDALIQYASRYTVRTAQIGIDGRVLFFTAAIATGVALLLAWAPPLPGLGAVGSAAGGARGGVGINRKRLQQGLVVSQLALSFMLLAGAGLLVRSLNALNRVDVGVNYENVVKFDAPSVTGMPVDANRAMMDDIVTRLQALPGVTQVAYATRAPFSETFLSRQILRAEGRDENGVPSPMLTQNTVSTDYFGALGIALVRGRAFDITDRATNDPIVIVNESLARQLFGEEDAVGKRIAAQQFNGQWGAWTEIVGVAADTREYGHALDGAHAIYRPAAQSFPGSTVMMRIAGDAGTVLSQVSSIVHELDPERPVDNLSTLEALRFEDLAPPRLNATLFTAFAALALLIAAVGVFGVLAFTVSQRTREFGLRMALGALERQVLGMVLREGAWMAGVAVLAGAIASILLARFLQGLLFNVSPADPGTHSAVAILLVTVAMFAAWLPARRATRAHPADALRNE